MLLQVLDVCEHYLPSGDSGELARQAALVFAKDMDGNLHRIEVGGLEHELFLAVPNSFSLQDAEELGVELDDHLLTKPTKCRVQGTTRCLCGGAVEPDPFSSGSLEACLQRRRTDKQAVVGVDLVWRRGFTGYEPHERQFARFRFSRSYYCSYVAAQFLTKFSKNLGVAPRYSGIYQMPTKFSESFINQTKIAGFDWIDSDTGKKAEHPPPETQTVPLRAMIFDIECLSPPGAGFPDAAKGHQIGMITAEHLPSSHIHCYVLGVCPCDLAASDRYAETDDLVRLAQEQGRLHVHHYANELEMICGFVRTSIQGFDPDVICGYNSNNFDIPYVIDRLRYLGCDKTTLAWTRVGSDIPVAYTRTMEFSEQKGTRPKATVHCPGRIVLDAFRNISEDNSLKLEDLSLNGVAKEFGLGTKGDVSPNQIYPYFHGTPQTRGKLLYYNIVDVLLTRQIMEVRMMVQATIVAARLYRVLPNEALNRGISYSLARCVIARSYDRYLHVTLLKDYNQASGGGEKQVHPAIMGVQPELDLRKSSIVGGYVPDPVVGFYDKPLAVLDFNSLYPSIIRAYNLCHTTWVRSEEEARDVLKLDMERDVWITPNKAIFVKAHVRRGVLPEILEDLIDRRNQTRKQQAAVDKSVIRVLWNTLESIQQAFKVAANSLYGQLSMKTSPLCLMLMGEAVTTYGQFLNKSVFRYVTEAPDLLKYKIEVVYGDTDSSMLLFDSGCTSSDPNEIVEAARRAAIEIAGSVNTKSGIMTPPLKVGIDSLNIRSIFLRKKGYAIVSISSTPGDAVKPKLKIKGLQFIKRDYCVFVRETGESFLKQLMVECKSKSECFQYLHQQFADLMSGRVDPDKLVLAKKLSKPLDEYGADATELHVAAGRQLVKEGELISPGDRVRYFICEPPPHLKSSRNVLKKEKVVAESIWRSNPTHQKIDYMHYAEGLVNSFDVIGPIVFGESNCSRLFDLHAYTAETARFIQMLTGGSSSGEPQSQHGRVLVYEEGARVGGDSTNKRAREAEMKEQVQRSAKFMDSFVSRGPKAMRGKPAGISLDD